MKRMRGLLSVLAVLVITLVLWMGATPRETITTLEHTRQILGALGLTGLASCFVVATKHPVIEEWFDGLGRAFVIHKWLAIGSVALLLVHALLNQVIKSPETVAGGFGGFAIFVVVAVVLVTLYNKKLPYERWRLVHRLMLVAFAAGLYHAYASAEFDLFASSPVAIWTALTALIGLAAGIWVVFFYRRRQFRHEGVITGVNRLSSDITEINITLARQMKYSKGQYAFVRIFQDGLEDAPHPFTISGGDGRDIRLTIKASGDFTKDLYAMVKPGTRAALSEPLGRMDFAHGGQHQLWIAGGIGITPFIAYLDQNEITQDVELFYSYRDKGAGIYADELASYAQRNPHFTCHLVDASVDGVLDFTDYELEPGTSVFMCGPLPMMKAYKKHFKKQHGARDITSEGFAFR
ncbi:MAG: ferric reductase-like transmembrane domain-containing protein [Coriobacteriia bacterium]